MRYHALALLAGTAVMGKPEESLGDNLDTFTATLSDDTVGSFVANSIPSATTLIGSATNRVVYDWFAYLRTRDSDSPQPSLAATIAREVHTADAATSPFHLTFSYSDGFGRAIQQKTQADPGPGPQRDSATHNIVVVDGVPQMPSTPIDPRWIASGWAIFNNKGSPVRQYEPFFTDTFRFEFAVAIGVASITFYDPLNREIGQLNPDHTWSESVVDPWSQEVWDVNDTAQIDPVTDLTLDHTSADYPLRTTSRRGANSAKVGNSAPRRRRPRPNASSTAIHLALHSSIRWHARSQLSATTSSGIPTPHRPLRRPRKSST